MKKTSVAIALALIAILAAGAQATGTGATTTPPATASGAASSSTGTASSDTGSATGAASGSSSAQPSSTGGTTGTTSGGASGSSMAPTAAPVTTTPAATPTPVATPQPLEGAHYIVTSALGPTHATLLLARLESLFELYDKTFRFDESRLPGKLAVREFATKADFDSYLLKIAGETRGDFVYVHYANPLKRELLVYDKPEPDYSESLAHQAFVQFLKAYIQDPPLWLLDGFAVLFEDVRFADGSADPVARENLAWLPTVKDLVTKGGLLPLDRLLNAGPEEERANIDVFYPEAWAFVSFLVHDATGDYSRLLWETIATLEPQGSLDDNQAAFAKRLSDWYGMGAAQKAFEKYVVGRKTYSELLASGTDLYSQKAFDKADAAFVEADDLDPTGYVAPYYLGLIAYAKGDWATADGMFREALARGCDPATATYAIGLNEIARGLEKEGAADLAKASAANPDRYKAKVDDILSKLGQP